MTTSPQPPRLTVGGYRLLSRLGEGGMGVVHLARRPGQDPVALKVLRPHVVGDDEARARLAREVDSLSRIRSRWVAEIIDADPWGDIPFVVTRYVPGLSLHDLVKEDGPVTGADLDWLARGLAEGIASVHEVGVLHRDVKPSNVLMEGRTPILIDFGLARVADDPKLTHTGWLLGTPGYLAPEILHGDDATPASDLHSWGATIAYGATGRAPFGRGPSMAIMDRVRRGQHDLDGLPGDLRDVVAATLDPDPDRRPDLDSLLDWLREPDVAPFPVPEQEDEHTMPLAHRPGSEERTTPVRDDAGRTRYLEDEVPEAPERTPFLQRVRRAVLLVAMAGATGAAITAFPWPAAAALLLVTWLLRSASLAASATLDRRRLRGARWYDPLLYLLGAPWHAVRAVPGTGLLVLWALGLALAAALVCYAVAAPLEPTLFASGLVFTLCLWLGPGGSRVRASLGWVVRPLSVSPNAWLLGVLVLAVAGGACGYQVLQGGIDWTPAGGPPWAGLDLEGWAERLRG